jgi:hypothetical protein
MMRALMTKTLFVLSILLSAQALAFDVGGFSYTVTSGTTVEVTGRASGNTATDIVIPATVVDSGTTYSVTTIGEESFLFDVFTSVNALTSVSIPDSVTNIGRQAFMSNDLQSVDIPDSVTRVEYGAFRENNILNSVTIGDSVTVISDAAFINNALTSVIIPDNVTYLSGFQGNPLTSVIIPGSVMSIGNGAFRATDLTSVIIPDSVTTIGGSSFKSIGLTSIDIPGSVTSIGPQAFSLNALTSLTIPNSVTTISKHAFLRNSLTNVAFEGNYFSGFKLDMFDGNENLVAITYCEGATGWPQTFNIIDYVTIPRLIASTSVDCSTAREGDIVNHLATPPLYDNAIPMPDAYGQTFLSEYRQPRWSPA